MILFIDPGRVKFGYAIYIEKNLKKHAVLNKDNLITFISDLIGKYEKIKIIMGDGTGHKEYVSLIKNKLEKNNNKINIELIDEKYSTEEARVLYFEMNPVKGWKKLIPKGLLIPKVEYDDYTAIVLANRYFNKKLI